MRLPALPPACAGATTAIAARPLSRDREGLDLARQILGARLRAAELARAGARQGARRDQFDEAVHAGDRAHAVADRLAQRRALGVVPGAALEEPRRRFLAARRAARPGGDFARL